MREAVHGIMYVIVFAKCIRKNRNGRLLMNKFTKKLVAVVMCGALLVPAGAMAAEPSQADQLPDEALQVLEDYNDAVVAAYEQRDVAIDANDFTNQDLVDQLEGRNDWLRSAQSGYDILEKDSDYTIDQVNDVNDSTIKVLATRTLDQQLDNDKTGEFPFYSATQEGYVLTKVDNQWKIARVVDETSASTPAFNAFKDSFDNDNECIATMSLAASEDAIADDFGGIDYTNLPDTTDYLSNDPDEVSDSGTSTYYLYAKANACAYAVQWALSRNPLFTDYSYSGGDCANFTSQCLNAGGMTYTSTWAPDMYQFINVNGQRDMLINTGRAVGYYQAIPEYPNGKDASGTVYHITDGASWYHAMIITQDPGTGYSSLRVSGHTADQLNVPIWSDISQIRSFRCV